jgi:hypothetical protein
MTASCATVTKVTNLSEESCRTSFTHQLSAILAHEGEKPEAANALAGKTVSTLITYDLDHAPSPLRLHPAPITGFLSTVREQTVC